MKNLDGPAVRLVDELDGDAVVGLADEVQLALVGIAEAAREGLLALSVTTGLSVLAEMMEADRTALFGPRDAKDPGRDFVRNGTTASSVTLGGRRVPIRRPRVKATDGSSEPALASFEAASAEDLLTQVVDLDRPRRHRQRQTLARRTDATPLVRSRDARSREVLPTRQGLPADPGARRPAPSPR